MLKNGLGELLEEEIKDTDRFVDLFAGSGAVAIHVARKFPVSVAAYDLQHYSVALTRSVVCRRRELNWEQSWAAWRERAELYAKNTAVPKRSKFTQETVRDFRTWCEKQVDWPITKAYGGHYFSPQQAVWIDSLRKTLPSSEPARSVSLAALIQAASKCAAAPGHTAQPFQPTQTAKPFLQDAWSKSILEQTKAAFAGIAAIFAKQDGEASVLDANEAAKDLNENDIAFIDPPYSGVHYSRFYHVLETIACGTCGEVSGVGRYPAAELRPRSDYSLKTESAKALDDLLQNIASRGAKAILTFPDHECSNGLSGASVGEIARKHFRVKKQIVKSKFSTLGGTSDDRDNEAGRAARQHADELILVLKPK